jgi:uncharacterized Tic20 family protein
MQEDEAGKESRSNRPGEENTSISGSSPQSGYNIAPVAGVQPLTPEQERTWAMLAHLSILANLVTGLLGIAIALVIYLVYKDRSRYVAFQSLQAVVFQLIVWLGGGVVVAMAWIVISLLMIVLVGFCLIPLGIVISVIPLAALCYGVLAGIQCNEGQDFRYWLVGDWVKGMQSNS